MASTLLSDVWNSSLSTEIPSGPVEPSLTSLPLYKVRVYIWYIGAPVILLLGNFGNIMTLIIMRKMTSGESVVNIYFTGLAIMDLITLDIYLLGDWLGIAFSFWVKFQSSVVCKVYNLIITSSTTISAWFLVCLTVHRALSVMWPHRVNLLCTRRRVIALLIGILAFFAAVYSHNLYGYYVVYSENTGGNYCPLKEGSYLEFVKNVFTYIDLVLYSLLPSLCLILANTVLVWKLRTSVRETRPTLAEGGSDHQTEGRQKTARAVTLTVILVSAAFIVLTLPACFFYVVLFVATFTGNMSVHDLAEAYAINGVVYMLMFCNNAVNFYLYCLTGNRFREEFFNIICCGRRGMKPVGAVSVSGGTTKK